MNLEDLPDDELANPKTTIIAGATTGERHLLEMIRRFKQSIENYNKETTKQTQNIIGLTNKIFWLTLAIGLVAIFQIIIAFA